MRQLVPLSERRFYWGSAKYECVEGPPDDEGPFQGGSGCGWSRRVYLGVGVGREVDGKEGVGLPEQAGFCAQCGGPLTLQSASSVGPPKTLTQAPEDAPVIVVPSKRIASRLSHRGVFVGHLLEPQEE